jgi:hypothetical protein
MKELKTLNFCLLAPNKKSKDDNDGPSFGGEFSQNIDINFEKRTFFGKFYFQKNCLFHKKFILK